MSRFAIAMLLALAALSLPSRAPAESPGKVGFAQVSPPTDPFEPFAVDARGEAMGLATTVNPRGPGAFWWNPAPLPEGEEVSVSFTSWEYPAGWLEVRPAALRLSRRNWTVGLLWHRLRLESELRTGHEPDGTGETFSARDDLLQLGLAADLVPWLSDGRSPWAWTVGANVRHFRRDIDWKLAQDVDAAAWDGDLGTSAAWGHDDGAAAIRLHATAMARNLFRGSWSPWELRRPLPRYYHFGVGAEMGLGPAWRGHRLLAGTVAFALRRDLEDLQVDFDSEHLGFELTAAGLVSLRAGHRSALLFSYPDGGWSWGAGLQYELAGLRAAVDYATFEATHGPLGWHEMIEHWTFTLGYALPD